MDSFWHIHLGGNPLSSWAMALGAGVLCFVALALLRYVVSRFLSRLRNSLGRPWLDAASQAVGQIHSWVLIILAASVAMRFLDLSDRVDIMAQRLVVAAIAIQLAFTSTILLRFIVGPLIARNLGHGSGQPNSIAALMVVLQVFAYVLIFLWALDNVGVNVSALLTGLGIGGIAVALALQNILGDLFASLTIALDHPFTVGDSVQVGTLSGKIERIGLKTTRIRSVTGEQIVFSNNDLLASRIQNLQDMPERRVLIRLGVVCETPTEKLKEIPQLIAGIIRPLSELRFDRVHLAAIGASSIDYELVYFVRSSNYELHMNRQQEILLGILDAFRTKGISLAYPTQTIFVNSGNTQV